MMNLTEEQELTLKKIEEEKVANEKATAEEKARLETEAQVEEVEPYMSLEVWRGDKVPVELDFQYGWHLGKMIEVSKLGKRLPLFYYKTNFFPSRIHVHVVERLGS